MIISSYHGREREREREKEDGGRDDMFRSEEMELVQLIIPAEAAHDTVQTLGWSGWSRFDLTGEIGVSEDVRESGETMRRDVEKAEVFCRTREQS